MFIDDRTFCQGNDEYITQVEQIIAEYKVLALQYHPDKNAGNKEAEAKFQKLKVCISFICGIKRR